MRLLVKENALQLSVPFSCPELLKDIGNSEQKLLYRPSNILYNSVIWCYKKEISLISSFSENVAAKENFLEKNPRDYLINATVY